VNWSEAKQGTSWTCGGARQFEQERALLRLIYFNTEYGRTVSWLCGKEVNSLYASV
jgi:hypothetical protein